LPSIRKIKAKKIAADIRAGVSDFELIAKYGISMEALAKVLNKLVEAGRIRKVELEERNPSFDDPANRLQTRQFPRAYLRLPLDIQDITDPERTGVVTDLSEDGFRTVGLEPSVGKEREFLIGSSEVSRRIRLSAKCIWAKASGQDGRQREAGFKIVQVSGEDLKEIRRLIGLLVLGDRNVYRDASPKR
jgi:hypothetical protein